MTFLYKNKEIENCYNFSLLKLDSNFFLSLSLSFSLSANATKNSNKILSKLKTCFTLPASVTEK